MKPPLSERGVYLFYGLYFLTDQYVSYSRLDHGLGQLRSRTLAIFRIHLDCFHLYHKYNRWDGNMTG